MSPSRPSMYPIRYWTVLAMLVGGLVVVAARALDLQVLTSDYLQAQGKARVLRTVTDNSHRGMILDRNGTPLAISTPVDSVWADPSLFVRGRDRWPALAAVLGVSVHDIAGQYARFRTREFMYLARAVTPELADKVMALKIPGVALQREYRRYYPAGPVAASVLGFTNIDDQGQEGLELEYNNWLKATPGRTLVLKDLFGNVVETVANLSLPVPGKDLVTSLDQRIQYLAYRELLAAVTAHQARGGAAVVLDARTGEVLALADVPSFNPNNRRRFSGNEFRDRAVTDVLEPGSTIKPFSIGAALQAGVVKPGTLIDTSPGSMELAGRLIQDTSDHGWLTVTDVIEKSSNVGASKIVLSMSKDTLWNMYRAVGFGSLTGSGLPGESPGLLEPPSKWSIVRNATLSYGYGIAVTPLQLARAYTALANGGVLMPVTLLRQDRPVTGTRVMSEETVLELRTALEDAASDEGTGFAADIPNYRVAGKTGTVHKLTPHGYAKHHYLAWFAGYAPATHPRLVMVVVVDDPVRGGYYGGEVAAPVFRHVMAGALRLLDIAPDAPEHMVRVQLGPQEGVG